MSVLTINAKRYDVDLPGDTPLLWVLRDHLGMSGTKFGCGMSLCGACTVFVAGRPVRACVTPLASIEGQSITTIEAMEQDPIGRKIQEAWCDGGVPQCGYCQPGQIMAATALLKTNPNPTDEDIESAMNGNICRCGTYTRIRTAIRQVATLLRQKS